jgi:hypothetical protein
MGRIESLSGPFLKISLFRDWGTARECQLGHKKGTTNEGLKKSDSFSQRRQGAKKSKIELL